MRSPSAFHAPVSSCLEAAGIFHAVGERDTAAPRNGCPTGARSAAPRAPCPSQPHVLWAPALVSPEWYTRHKQLVFFLGRIVLWSSPLLVTASGPQKVLVAPPTPGVLGVFVDLYRLAIG